MVVFELLLQLGTDFIDLFHITENSQHFLVVRTWNLFLDLRHKTSLLWFLTWPIKPCYNSLKICLCIHLTHSAIWTCEHKLGGLCFIIWKTINLVLKFVLDLIHIANDIICTFSSFAPTLFLQNFIFECLNLSILIPVIEEPIQGFILALFIIWITRCDLIGPRKLVNGRRLHLHIFNKSRLLSANRHFDKL